MHAHQLIFIQKFDFLLMIIKKAIYMIKKISMNFNNRSIHVIFACFMATDPNIDRGTWWYGRSSDILMNYIGFTIGSFLN
jgi:type IV secretory pathway VirB3-like protein